MAAELAPLLTALADPTRRRVVQLLSESPLRAGELAAATRTSAPNMSRHLRVLLEAGIVADERPADDARTRVFWLRPEAVAPLRDWLDALQVAGDRAACVFQAARRREARSMSEPRTRRSTVEVTTDPATAFAVFTRELDLWWVRGPINAYDSGRLVEMRCEPGVGGRILEVYDGDALELARITVWEPGRRLAWQSSLDDVAIDVRFAPSPAGTIVTLDATVRDGGEDRGGSSFVAVTPAWLGAWMRRRDSAPGELRDLGRVALTLRYARPAAAARWLADVFGFEPPSPLPEGDDPLTDGEYGFPWVELHAGNSSLVVEPLPAPPVDHAQVTHVPWVFVDDVEAHLAHARDRGATIVQEIEKHGYTSYVALDLEGRPWRFAQARPTQP